MGGAIKGPLTRLDEQALVDQMSTSPVQIRGSVTYRQKWQDVDWAMRAVTVAARLFEIAGESDLCDRLLLIHREAMERRDRA